MSQVLVISGHPELDSSYTNKVILNQLGDNISDIEVRRLIPCTQTTRLMLKRSSKR
ncbi:NAD(P)H oxidoreductase YRKL [Vibrio variabilis]|uniref:NAD(P)H oxidoreductase YRKL n=1 Tax=Vibrio variabilis TaxID=990271 RepID=A0ABQ0JCW8_9VIBR|nr:NAD(P)H oxidoreductase YRKL [Vibrio variabilis]